MLETVFLVAILCVIPLARYSTMRGDGFTLKHTLFILAGLLYLCIKLFTGFTFTGNILFYFVSFCTLSMVWSVNFEQAWEDVAKWWALYALFVITSLVPVKTVMLLSMIPIPLFLVMGFMQDVYPGKDYFDEMVTNRIKTNMDTYGWRDCKGRTSFFIGSIGNSNHAACFLAPYTFITIYLSYSVSPYFAILLPFILYGLYRTKCHASWLSVMAGSFFLFPPYSLIVGAVVFTATILLAFIYRKKIFKDIKLHSLHARFYYWIVAFRLWKKSPVYGYGLKSYRKEIYEEQGKMNMEGGKYNHLILWNDRDFLAYPTRAHNDFIEVAVETGIIGLALFVAFIASVFISGISAGNWVLLGGFACLVANGFLFYPTATFSYVPYFVLASVISAPTVSIISLPFAAGCVLSAFFVKLAISYVINPHIALIWFSKAHQTEDIVKQNQYIDKALSLAPTSGTILAWAVEFKKKFDIVLAKYYAERALHYADGSMRMWYTWAFYGDMQARTGNWEGAKRSIRYALFLNPWCHEAKDLLAKMEEIEKQGRERAEAEQKKIRDEQISNLVLPHKRRDAAWR